MSTSISTFFDIKFVVGVISGVLNSERFDFSLSSTPCYRVPIIDLGPICIVVGTVKNKSFGVTFIMSMAKPIFGHPKRVRIVKSPFYKSVVGY